MNTSGFIPLDLRVLVLPDEVSDTFEGSSLLRPDAVKDQQKWAQARGTLVAVGDNAWEEARARAPGIAPPRAGDRILYGKYSGQTVKGADGKDYQIMNDEDVLARLKEE